MLIAGDLNGDGRPDLVADDAEGIKVLLNHGDSSFAPARRYPFYGYLALGDLNGDGAPDLLTSGVSALINGGDGKFVANASYPGGGPLALADFNGDGRLDFASAGGYDDEPGTVWVQLNTPGLCNVQEVAGLTPAAAKRVLGSVNCKVGKVTHAHTNRAKKGQVANYSPKFGAVLPGGGKVNLVVSLGPRPKR